MMVRAAGQQAFSVKDQIANLLGIIGHRSLMQVFNSANVKNECGYIAIKYNLCKQELGCIWLPGCSLMTPGVRDLGSRD